MATASLHPFLTTDSGFWGDLALKVLVNVSPSVQWANKVAEPWLGLPYGVYLHGGRPRRPRALTMATASPEQSAWYRLQLFAALSSGQTCDDQPNSGFLSKLPLDVRVMIYDLVLGGSTIHVSAGDNHSRIYHFICKVPQRITESQIHGQCHQLTTKRPSAAPRGAASTKSLSWTTLSRLRRELLFAILDLKVRNSALMISVSCTIGSTRYFTSGSNARSSCRQSKKGGRRQRRARPLR